MKSNKVKLTDVKPCSVLKLHFVIDTYSLLTIECRMHVIELDRKMQKPETGSVTKRSFRKGINRQVLHKVGQFNMASRHVQ